MDSNFKWRIMIILNKSKLTLNKSKTTFNNYVVGTPSVTYATWSPTNKSSFVTLSGGNLISTTTRAFDNDFGRANIGITDGQTAYYEITYTQDDPLYSYFQPVSVSGTGETIYDGHTAGEVDGFTINVNGDVYINSNIDYGLSVPMAIGDVMGIGLNCITGLAYIYVNDTLAQTVGTLGASWFISGHTYYPACGAYQALGSTTANFGQSSFVYSHPEFTQGVF